MFFSNIVAGKLIFCIICSCTRNLNTQASHIVLHRIPIGYCYCATKSFLFAVWYFLHSSWCSDSVGDIFKLCAGMYVCVVLYQLFLLLYMPHKVSTYNLRFVKLQAHLAPSGYLKIPTVSSVCYIATCISWQPMFFLFYFCSLSIFSVNHLLVLYWTVVAHNSCWSIWLECAMGVLFFQSTIS